MKIDPKTNLAVTDYSEMDICDLAQVILKDWTNMYFGAVPYVEAMGYVRKLSDPYGVEDGATQVIYFLGNANTWRGEVARQVKKELNKRVKESYKH